MAVADAWCPRGCEDLGVASSVGGLWARNALARPSSRCVAEYSSEAGAEAGRLSWAAFDAAAWGCGAALKTLAPSRVALLAHPTAAQYCCAAGAARAGLSACVLNWRQPAGALAHALAVSAPEVLVASAPFADLAAAAAAGSAPVARLAAVATAALGFAADGRLLAPGRHAPGGPPPAPAPDAAPGAAVFVFFTSGSTGRPKGAPRRGKTKYSGYVQHDQ